MKLLKINRFTILLGLGLGLVLLYSCSNNTHQIDAYKSEIMSNLSFDAKKGVKGLDAFLDDLLVKEEIIYQRNAIDNIGTLKKYKDSHYYPKV